MKNLKSLLVVVALLISGTQAFAGVQEDRAEARAKLTKIYNKVSKMSQARYVKTLGKIAKMAEKSDMKAEAALFRGLQSQPESQAEFAALLQDKIEDQSENGIYLIFYLARAVPWCYVGDIHCGMGVALLSILTLEGEEGENF